MLKHRFISVLCVASLVLPLAAHAAVKKATLSNVVSIVQNNTKPVQYAMTVKGAYDKYSALIMVQGRGTDDLRTLQGLTTEIDITLHLNADDKGTLRADAQFRIIDGTMYLFLESVTATGELDELTEQVEPYLKKWISFPVDPDEYRASVHQHRGSAASLRRFDRFFTIKTSEIGSNTVYDVTLPRQKQSGFFRALLGVSRGYASPRVNASMRRSARTAALDLLFQVKAFPDSTFESGSVSSDFSMPIEGKKLTVSYDATSKTVASYAPITAPAGATPFHELQDTLSEPGFSDARDAQRRADVNTIVNAVHQYAIDNNGTFPATLQSGKMHAICKTGAMCDGISLEVLNGLYLVRMPTDPSSEASNALSGYTIEHVPTGRIRVTAPLAETVVISVTR